VSPDVNGETPAFEVRAKNAGPEFQVRAGSEHQGCVVSVDRVGKLEICAPGAPATAIESIVHLVAEPRRVPGRSVKSLEDGLDIEEKEYGGQAVALFDSNGVTEGSGSVAHRGA